MRFTIFRLTSFGTSEFFDIVMFLFMGDKMKHILQDNALESWAMAIKYSNFILNGKAILQYRKQFVSSLHNAVEKVLFGFLFTIRETYGKYKIRKEGGICY